MTHQGVHVTCHAADQAAARYGPTLLGEIARDVRDAIAGNRMSCHLPVFAMRAGTTLRYRNHPGRGRIRYVWTADQARVYVVRLTGDGPVVLTALPTRAKAA